MSAAATSLPSRSRPPWLDAFVGQGLALLFAFAIAVAVGSLIIILYGENPLTVYGAMLSFGFRDATSLGNILSIATPLIFAALAVSVCFKGGLFNIGVEGQFLVGMVTASWAALAFDFLPGLTHMIVVLVFACIGGMVYAAVPGILKVTTGAHEVVTTIMMNQIAISIVKFALDGPLRFTKAPPGQNVDLRTDIFESSALVPDLGHLFGVESSAHLSWLFPIAIVASVFVWFLIKRMRLGYEARAVGSSAGSARAGGISIGSVQIKLFLISGALAGLVGMQQVLAERGALVQNYEAQLGFTGIAVAFLGQNNPIGIVFAAILWAFLSRGETALQIETDVPREFVIILQGILIFCVVVVYQIAKRRLARRELQRAGAEVGLRDTAAPSDLALEEG
ncbi:MAG: putative sugar transporter, permease protein [Actinomycetia bacterium]|nr:putative sugar transporter, permease protein [Actinomycetes bacterium]